MGRPEQAALLRGAMHASEDRLREVYEAVGCGILVRDPSGTIIFANEQAARIFGLPADELVGTQRARGVRRYAEDGKELADPELPSTIARTENRPIRDVRTRLVRADGVETWIRVDSVPVPSADGSLEYVVNSMFDVTERMRAEERLALRVRQQAAVAELGRLALAANDLDALFAETVRTVNGLLGADACRVIEHKPFERRLSVRAGTRLGAGSAPEWIADDATGSQAGFTVAQGTDVISNDLVGEKRFAVYGPIVEAGFNSTATVIIPGHERPFGVLAAISRSIGFSPDDVVFMRAVANILGEAIERLSAIQRVRANEARLRTVVEHLPLELMVYDALGRVTLATGRRVPGRTLVLPVVGDSIFDVNRLNPDGLNRIVRALRGEEIHEEVRAGRNVIDMRHQPVFSADGTVTEVVGLALDVTERANAEAALARKEAFVRAIFDSVETHLAVLDRGGVIVDANEHWLEQVRSGQADMKDA
ncbi:MAG: PAS domain S-box protein, partial [Chloroflexota bacterium]|nr:PAS domain S-box protein [Chloroflexota bacterium]